MKQRTALYLIIFTVSGFSGLIYESIWSHYLKLFLGHAAYAQTLVLAIFMGGMALGSWLCSTYSGRWKNLFLTYAVAEALIGLCALVFHPVFDRTVQISYSSIIPHLSSPSFITFFKWTISSLLILPQTILLGMTFPLMTGGMLRRGSENPGRMISMLYFSNSIGAAVGVLMSGFVLIRFWGLPGTIQTAGVINLVLAAAVWLLLKKQPISPPAIQAAAPAGEGPRTWRWLIAASLLTGAASFIYEIAWIRMLNFVLGSSTHAFELMLSAFIFGLAFGGLWIRRRIDQLSQPIHYLIGVQLAMGLLAIATLPLYGNTFRMMHWLLERLDKTELGYILFTLASHGIALAIMLPATFCAGMTLPLITYSLLKFGHGERSIGAVYAWNTIGGILGVFFAIHIGMPFLGLKKLIIFGGSIDMALGLALFWMVSGIKNKTRPLLASAASMAFVVLALLVVHLDLYKMASGVYRTGMLMTPAGSHIVYYKDGKTATVSVVRMQLLDVASMSIRTNGKIDAGMNIGRTGGAANDESTMILAGVLPLALMPGAKTAANIGFGSGLTTHTLLQWPELKTVDTVEIEPVMVDGAKQFGDRVSLAFTDPRSRVHIDDAKTFFSSQQKKYDVIVSEPSNPWTSGVAGLFSQEFYRLIRGHLAQGGVFCQWVQLYETNEELIASILKAVSANFSDFVLYAANTGDLLILASDRPLSGLDPRVLAEPSIQQALKRVGIESMQDLEIRRIGNKKLLGAFFDSYAVRVNSDYYPVLDQNAERARFLKESGAQLIDFTTEPLPVKQMAGGGELPAGATRIMANFFFPPSGRAVAAMALRDHFLYGTPLPVFLGSSYKEQAEAVDRMFGDCKARQGEDVSLASLYGIAGVLTPYLTPREIDAIWARLDAKPCARSLSNRQRNWISFFKALGRRDPRDMERTAQQLLNQEQNLPQGVSRLLVASAMLGYLEQNDKKNAERLWQDYRFKLYGRAQPNLVFRLLSAQAGSSD